VVPGARHLVSLGRPVAFSRVLLEAVDDVAASRGPVPADGPAREGRDREPVMSGRR
jgi:hypothetical protein